MLNTIGEGLFSISLFPIILELSLFVCMWVVRFGKRYSNEEWRIVNKALGWVLFGALLGGKILYAMASGKMENGLLGLFGGFVFYGALLGGGVALVIYASITKKNILYLSDLFFKVLPLGQTIGRLGCYFNGCCFGKEYYGIFSVPYSINGMNVRVWPTWFFESGFCLLLFIHLYYMKNEEIGIVTVKYMLFYSIFRFVIEFLRGDDIRGMCAGISTSQGISLGVFFLGVVGWIHIIRRKAK